MALVIGKKSTRKIKITAEEAGDFAEVTKHVFDVEFKIVKKEELDGIRETSNAGDEDLAINLIFESVVGVTGVKDEAGADIPYSKDLVEILKDTAFTRTAILQNFWAVQGGITQPALYKALKAKN